MENCKICKNRLADKKGSHIIPHFLLKRIENVDGRKERDYELGFVIQEFNTDSYFGRAVSPEKLDSVYGNISDEEINKNKHPSIVDFFFCTTCEERLAKTESIYAKSIENVDTEIYESGINGLIGVLFWSSVIWRISINGKNGVKLTELEEETLRCFLDCYLDSNSSDVKIKDIKYKLIRCCNYSASNSTLILLHPDFSKPYSLLLDEYLLLFSFSDFNDYLSKDFFGIKKDISYAPINNGESNEKILPISNTELVIVCNKIVTHMKQLRVFHINRFLDMLHISIGGIGKTMPDFIKREVLAEITSEEKRLGRKYNIEDLKASTIKVMTKYGPSKGN